MVFAPCAIKPLSENSAGVVLETLLSVVTATLLAAMTQKKKGSSTEAEVGHACFEGCFSCDLHVSMSSCYFISGSIHLCLELESMSVLRATNNAGPSRIISSAKPSNKASTNQPNPKSYTTPIIGIGNCSKCGELGHRSNECTAQMSANLIKEYVEDDEKGDGYDEEDIKVVEDVGDPVNSCMQRHHEEEKSPNQHNISRANGSMFGKVCKLTIDDGNCYNINSKVLDRYLNLEIETQPKLYIMEVDKSYEGIVRWPMSAHEFYWHQLDSRNLNVEAFTGTIMTHGEIKVKIDLNRDPLGNVLDRELNAEEGVLFVFLDQYK
nr:zf-CCHC domain-containing protein [Ipomoea batatas]